MVNYQDKFNELVRNQFVYGGQKYALSAEKESTDVLFDTFGKNWLLGTMCKYCFRFKNLARERDILKIACYVYILWLKRGFFIKEGGFEYDVVDTNVKLKDEYFNIFVEKVNQVPIMELTSPDWLSRIQNKLVELAKEPWGIIKEKELFYLYINCVRLWQERGYFYQESHDEDVNNGKK